MNFIIGVIDYLTGYEIRVEVFYLMPVGLLSWLVNRRAVIIMPVISTLTTTTAILLASQVIQIYLIEFWNALVYFSFFIIIFYLIAGEKIISDNNKIFIDNLQKSLDEI
jgi:hypothetical protein